MFGALTNTWLLHQLADIHLLNQSGVAQPPTLQNGLQPLIAESHWIDQLSCERASFIPDHRLKYPGQHEEHNEVEQQKEQFEPHVPDGLKINWAALSCKKTSGQSGFVNVSERLTVLGTFPNRLPLL